MELLILSSLYVCQFAFLYIKNWCFAHRELKYSNTVTLFRLRGHLGTSGPLIVPLHHLVIFHLIQLKANILWNADKCWYRLKGILSTWLQKFYGYWDSASGTPSCPLKLRWDKVAIGVTGSGQTWKMKGKFSVYNQFFKGQRSLHAPGPVPVSHVRGINWHKIS